MGEKEKVTIMVLRVDLQCEKCYRKVKKVLSKFPQIRDQTYDEKNNLVIIKVVCCSPEKIRDKICYKGGGAIKSIEIKEPDKPKPPPAADKPKPPPAADKPKEAPKEKPKEADKPKEKPKEAEKSKEVEKPKEKPKEESKPKPAPAPAEPAKPVPAPAPVPAYPTVTMNACCMECYGGHGGGPCQTGYGGYGGGAAPYIQYDGYYGTPVHDSYGGGRSYATTSYCVTRPDYFSEENPQACAIM